MLISCGNVVIFNIFPQVIAYWGANIKKISFPGKVDTIVVINKKQQIIHDLLLSIYSLYHQHNTSICLNKNIRKAADNGINLIGCNWLPILADMQLLAVNHFCNLLRPHPPVLGSEAVKYGFFDFHHFSNKDSATTTF